jgi:hypothetical protein
MSNQIVITSGAKVRNLSGVLTGTSGVVSSVGFGTANGVATLDGSGKVPLSQLPASVITYLGTWNASTNTPTLTNGVGDTGDLYICNVAGTVNFGAGPITFAVGDWVIYSGTTWEKSGGASGTVTSVAMTVPTGLSVTGSPITTSGTLAVDLASGYTIPTTSFLSGLVPYTGATSNVNLGEYGLSGGYLGLDTTPTGTPTSVGTLSWDTTYLTPKVVTGTGATTLQIGQEEVILIHNNTGSTLTDGQVVYVTGSTGELPSVSLADASSETTSAATLGVITETIANGANGFATVSGIVHGLNTLAYNEGDLLWLSETAGQFTNVKPISPAHLVLIGYVIKKAGGNGSILVKIQNTQELEECSDVLFTSLANNDILAYESSTSLWKNKTIANVLGYTPANAATYVPYTGATTNVNLGNNTLSAYHLNINGDNTTTGGSLIFRQSNTNSFGGTDTTSILTQGKNTLIVAFNQGSSASYKFAYFLCDAIPTGSTAMYYLPASSGTLALTSDIPTSSTYVDLTSAQTITGIKTFTNEQLFGNGITLTGGYITYTSGSFNLTLNTNLLTANRNIYLPDVSGTVALTSNLTDFVTTNTMQTITGLKTFSNDQTFNGNIIGTTAYFSGNLGIGNTSPSYKLDVTGTGRFTSTLNANSILNVGNDLNINKADSDSVYTGSQIWLSGTYTGIRSGTNHSFNIDTYNSGSVKNAFTILQSGNVGIGISSPTERLEIAGLNGNIRIYGRSGIADNQITSNVYYNGSAWVRDAGAYGAAAINLSSNGLITFNTTSATSGFPDERIRITSGGALLIGRSTVFSIFGDSNGIVEYGDGTIYCAANSTEAMGLSRRGSDGTVVLFRKITTTVGSISVTGSSTAYNTSSDYRLKQDFKDFNGLNIISNLKMYDFEWKNDSSRSFGAIAHELEEVLPYAVNGEKDAVNKEGEILPQGVDYSKLVPVLVKAIQELKAEIDELKNK